MTANKVSSRARRFTLPALCAVLAVASALWGEIVLVEQAGQPTIGPLVAAQVAVLLAVAFAVLSVITLLLALFPGRDTPADDTDEHLADDELGLDDTPHESTDAIIAALKKSAAKQTHARITAEGRAQAAGERVEELEAQVAAFRSGTAPEMKALRSKYREEATRDALRKVHELGEASERLAQALKEARSRAETDLAEARTRAEADLTEVTVKAEADLAAAHAQAEADLAAKDDQIRDALDQVRDARREAAIEAHHRIQIALAAINETRLDVHDHLQREAVRVHAARITDALNRIAPEAEPEFGPDLPLPPLEAASDPASAIRTGPAQASKKRGRLFRRPKRRD